MLLMSLPPKFVAMSYLLNIKLCTYIKAFITKIVLIGAIREAVKVKDTAPTKTIQEYKNRLIEKLKHGLSLEIGFIIIFSCLCPFIS